MAWFWRQTRDSIQGMHELVQSVRTADDPWLQEVLSQDRMGCESWEVYCFTHGIPTHNVGTWLPSTNKPMCGNAQCEALATEWLVQRRLGFTWKARHSANPANMAFAPGKR